MRRRCSGRRRRWQDDGLVHHGDRICVAVRVLGQYEGTGKGDFAYRTWSDSI